MTATLTASDLRKQLKTSGTPDRNLTFIDDVLEKNPAATGDDGLMALIEGLHAGHGTVGKAKAILGGKWKEPKPVPKPPEQVLPKTAWVPPAAPDIAIVEEIQRWCNHWLATNSRAHAPANAHQVLGQSPKDVPLERKPETKPVPTKQQKQPA